jgi:hypothetical protein
MADLAWIDPDVEAWSAVEFMNPIFTRRPAGTEFGTKGVANQPATGSQPIACASNKYQSHVWS